jgi:hypothetical protein
MSKCALGVVMITLRVRWAGHVACMVMRNAYEIVVGNLKERNYLEDMCKWKNNIKMDLKEIGR